MEDFNKLPLCDLINVWCDLATPDFDLFLPSDNYCQKKMDIEYIIQERIGISRKDTMMLLNTKRVIKEEKRSFYIRENKRTREIKIKNDKGENEVDKSNESNRLLTDVVRLLK